MIIYFTGTGNSLAIARRIATTTKDTLVDLGAQWKKGEFDITLTEDETLGFVFPVYRWTLPPLVAKYLEKATITVSGDRQAPAHCFAAISYGYFPGSEAVHLDRLLRDRFGFGLDASYHVRSAATCLYVSNPPDENRQRALANEADACASRIAQAVVIREKSPIERGTPLGRILSLGTGASGLSRSTKPFRLLEERCTGCGTCARCCPTNSISIEGGQPVWSGSDCTECFACLHRCPTEASQYSFISKNRRRYTHPDLVK